jgi:cystathionine beta-lyase/cystathionine gamma-synthase
MMSERSFATKAVLDARAQAQTNTPAVLPIYASAGWVFRTLDEVDAIYEGRMPGTVYGGSGVPNHEAFEALVASLHGAETALATAAGMSAFTVALLHLASAKARIVAAHDLYGNTTKLLRDFERFGVTYELVDISDLRAVAAALHAPTTLLLVESISNPRIRVADLAALSRLAHDAGALLLVDNSLASPYHCRPIELGADLVIESVTKFLGGHYDIVLGCIAGTRAAIEPMRALASRIGVVGSVFETWLGVRSIATLEVRMARSSENAHAIAKRLVDHPKVHAVHYPALARQPHVGTTLRNGFGSMLSFEIAPERAATDRLLGALGEVKLVLSFGGAQTTLSHPATSSHRLLGERERAALGIHDGFLRLSAGLEDAKDIIEDLERGLEAV